MYKHWPQTLATAGTLLLQLVAVSPAYADDHVTQSTQRRSIPVNSGFIVQRGWEADLIRANSNLQHYMFVPMSSMIHRPAVIVTGTTIVQNDPDGISTSKPVDTGYQSSKPRVPSIRYEKERYLKPDHVPTVTSSLPRAVKPNHVLITPRDHLSIEGSLLHSRPYAHIALPTKVLPQENSAAYGVLNHEKVSGQLLTHQRTSPPALVATYEKATNIALQNQRQAREMVSGSVISASTHGTLLHK